MLWFIWGAAVGWALEPGALIGPSDGEPLTWDVRTLQIGQRTRDVARPTWRGLPVLGPASPVQPAFGNAAGAAASRSATGRRWTVTPKNADEVWWVTASGWGLARAVHQDGWRVWRDTVTGETLAGEPWSRDALADVYPLNPVVSQKVRVTLDGLTGLEVLAGDRVTVASCTEAVVGSGVFGARLCEAQAQRARADADGDFVYDEADDLEAFAEVNAYHHVHEALVDVGDRLGELAGGLDIFVNIDSPTAFWGDFNQDGASDLVLGSAFGDVNFALDRDVIDHELAHGLIRAVSDPPWYRATTTGLDGAGPALEEGLADAWSIIRAGDPFLGEFAAIAFDQTELRDLSEALPCEQYRVGEAHRDGRPLAHLFWELSAELGLGDAVVQDLWLAAASALTGEVSWGAVESAVRLETERLWSDAIVDEAAYAAVIERLDEASLGSCDAPVVVREGSGWHEVWLLHPGGADALVRDSGSAVRFVMNVPENIGGLWLEVEPLSGFEDGSTWRALWRRDQPVAFEPRTDSQTGMSVAVPVSWDHRSSGGAEEALMWWSTGTGVPLPAGRPLHLSFAVHQDRSEARTASWSRLRFRVSTVSGAMDGRGRCGCRTPAEAPWAWVVLICAAAGRRRRLR